MADWGFMQIEYNKTYRIRILGEVFLGRFIKRRNKLKYHIDYWIPHPTDPDATVRLFTYETFNPASFTVLGLANDI